MGHDYCHRHECLCYHGCPDCNPSAALSAQDGAVGVKGLEWKGSSDAFWYATTVVGQYQVRESGLYGYYVQLDGANLQECIGDNYKTQDAAKAAAQADYEARIRSALSPSPAQEEDRGGTWSDDGKVYVGPAQEAGAEPVGGMYGEYTPISVRSDTVSPPLDRGGEWGFSDALEIARRGFDAWAAKPHNKKWFKRIDGTPIPNDLLVNIAEALASSPSPEGQGDG